jgi:hypothetical protein
VAKTFDITGAKGCVTKALWKRLHQFQLGCSTVAVLFVFLILSATVSAQTASIYSSIIGTVTDSTGALVSGAVVTVTNPATGISFSAISDDQGYYHVDRLVLGTYNLTVTHNGFAQVVCATHEYLRLR